MLFAIIMLHQLQIVLECKVTRLTVEPSTSAPFPHCCARRHQHCLSHHRSHIEPFGACFCIACIWRSGSSPVVLFAGEFGFVAQFAFFTLFSVADGGSLRVLLRVPCFPEG